jgi:hypothetical protein
MLLSGSGNRDPQEFPNPETNDLTRRARRPPRPHRGDRGRRDVPVIPGEPASADADRTPDHPAAPAGGGGGAPSASTKSGRAALADVEITVARLAPPGRGAVSSHVEQAGSGRPPGRHRAQGRGQRRASKARPSEATRASANKNSARPPRTALKTGKQRVQIGSQDTTPAIPPLLYTACAKRFVGS